MANDAEKFIRFCESDFGKRVLEREVEYVYRELKGCRRILDAGCGIGQFEEKIQDLNITGLDISAEMLEEARKRSNKRFVVGNAENLNFQDSSFDAVFYVATLEFIDNYQKAVQEAHRVTMPNGKLLAMMLNPESEYFKEHMQREGSYFRKIRHTNLREIRDYISGFYEITKEGYFLGIRDQQIFDTAERRFASLYIIVGKKRREKMKIGIILNTNDAETCWNCFRFGNEALRNNHSAKIFLLGKGVEIENVKDDKFPLLEGSIKKFIRNNGTMLACGTCLRLREKEIGLCPISAMEDMLKIVEESDRVITFG